MSSGRSQNDSFNLGHDMMNDDSVQSSSTTVSSGERRNLLERYLVYRRNRSSVSVDNLNPSMSSSSMMRPLALSSNRFQPYASPALTASTSSPFSSSSVSFMSSYPESPFMLPSSYTQLSSMQALSAVDLGESRTMEERIFSSYLNSESMTKRSDMASHDSQVLQDSSPMGCSRTCLSLLSRQENDAMVYLEGPRVYSCIHCRTHLTTHDDIISKSFHGRNGRAFLFENCANVIQGPAEDRRLLTGLHSVCDIFCKRCKTLIGWTYEKAYETSQKYKEGKFIVEKIHLFMEESSHYDINPPAGERRDLWKIRSMSWGQS